MNNFFHVFVYGTLKRGFRNHKILTRNKAEYLGKATTQDTYIMFDVGYPLIVNSISYNSAPVLGEIYLVNGKCLTELDTLENEGVMYTREKIKLLDDQTASAYIWIGEPEGAPVLPNMLGVIDWRPKIS